MQENSTIALAEKADAAALERLVNSAYRGESSRLGWTTEADILDGTRINAEYIVNLVSRPDTRILKYTVNDRILACVELQKQAENLYLGMLTVTPELQGKGIGKVLLRAAESEAIRLGCTKIHMTVISLRTELIAWYQRHGFVDTGERKPFKMADPVFGLPKKELEFAVLEKKLF